jgi:choline dehydrogenase-like flavoprotein
MDSMKAGSVGAILPVMRNRPPVNEDGAGGSHMTIPRFNYHRKNQYYGGYFLLGGTGFGSGPGDTGALKGWGLDLKKQIRANNGASITLRGYGERLPEYSNYFEIDPQNNDRFGIPQVRFHVKPSDNDRKMMEDMYDRIEEILRACGAEVAPFKRMIEPMGDATHEAGAARMGTDPKNSFLNPYCQSHDVKNLFVTDASCFVSMPGTHGITTLLMALSWRASEYLADQMKKGDLA